MQCNKLATGNGDASNEDTFDGIAGCRFRVFVTNALTWDAAKILATYAKRWTIETSYEVMSQDLNLHGCKWRDLQGQYSFIALTFLSYLFLMWAKVHGRLTHYGDHPTTIGELKRAFIHECQEEFVKWRHAQERARESDPVENWIAQRVYCKAG